MLVLVVPFVALGAFVLGILQAGNPITPGPLKIGVVDLAKVADGYQKRKERESEINKAIREAESQLKAFQKKIESMSSELDLLDRKSPEYSTKRKELVEKIEEARMRRRLAEIELNEKGTQYLQEVFSEILAKVEEYRAANNYDFILRVDNKPLTSQDQLVLKMVMAYNNAFDVTDDVIAYLNKSPQK
jgi:Skp family chaperone for outer membrane proteins